MPETTNPFQGVMTTAALTDKRKAEFDQRWGKQDFWVYEAADAGRQVRAGLLQQGIALTDEDEKALQSDAIMKSASQRATELMNSGELKQNDAQKFMIEHAMQAFISSGDYDAAASMAPALRQIYTAEAELAKIGSESAENLATAAAQGAQAGRTAMLLPYEISKTEAETAERLAAEQERLAQARLHDRMPKEGGKGEKGGMTEAAKTKWGGQLAGARGAVRRLGDIFELIATNPGVGSDAAQTISNIQSAVKNSAYLLKTTGDPIDVEASEKVEGNWEGAISNAWAKRPKGALNVKQVEFRSAVMDLAYALAKARDPGGRLSDADVRNALDIIGVSGDPVAMGNNLIALAHRTFSDVGDIRDSYIGFQSDEFSGWTKLQEEMELFKQKVAKYSTQPKGKGKGTVAPATPAQAAPAGPAKGVAPSGWTQTEKGVWTSPKPGKDGQPIVIRGVLQQE